MKPNKMLRRKVNKRKRSQLKKKFLQRKRVKMNLIQKLVFLLAKLKKSL